MDKNDIVIFNESSRRRRKKTFKDLKKKKKKKKKKKNSFLFRVHLLCSSKNYRKVFYMHLLSCALPRKGCYIKFTQSQIMALFA